MAVTIVTLSIISTATMHLRMVVIPTQFSRLLISSTIQELLKWLFRPVDKRLIRIQSWSIQSLPRRAKTFRLRHDSFSYFQRGVHSHFEMKRNNDHRFPRKRHSTKQDVQYLEESTGHRHRSIDSSWSSLFHMHAYANSVDTRLFLDSAFSFVHRSCSFREPHLGASWRIQRIGWPSLPRPCDT